MSYTSPVFPTTIPTYTDLREVTNDVDDIIASDHNDLMKELVAICIELGTLPRGTATDLKTRLSISLSDDGCLLPSAPWTSVPAFPTSAGIPGEQAYDADYHYVCIYTNTWARADFTPW